jgi:hypothetical protein
MRERIGTLNVILMITMICLTLFAGSVAAHHSRAGIYESNDHRITLEGSVVEWKWRNPHTFLVFDVNGSDGKVVQWSAEASSPPSMVAEGMSKDSFKGGEPVKVVLVPAKAGTPRGLLVKVETTGPGGRVVLDRSRFSAIPD